MPSISHRASLGPGAPHRARSGPAALPAGSIGERLRRAAARPFRWCADRIENWRQLHQLRELDDHLLRDIGLTAAEAQRSTIFRSGRTGAARDPKGPPTWPTTS